MEEKNMPKDEWNLSKEREFMENLLCKRFNFFLLFFSIVSAGAIQTAIEDYFIISMAILLVGGVILWLLASVLKRGQDKFEIIFGLLDKNHPAIIVDNMTPKNKSRRKYIGIHIPQCCCLIITLFFVIELFYYIIRSQLIIDGIIIGFSGGIGAGLAFGIIKLLTQQNTKI